MQEDFARKVEEEFDQLIARVAEDRAPQRGRVSKSQLIARVAEDTAREAA